MPTISEDTSSHSKMNLRFIRWIYRPSPAVLVEDAVLEKGVASHAVWLVDIRL